MLMFTAVVFGCEFVKSVRRIERNRNIAKPFMERKINLCVTFPFTCFAFAMKKAKTTTLRVVGG